MKKQRLVLIDGHSLLYRAFHAFPPLTTSKGELINAVYGFTSILLSVIAELDPSHLAVTFDKDKPTFRHTDFVGYKAQREEMPTELKAQQKRVAEVVEVLNIPVFAVEGYEADDVIGALAHQSKEKGKGKKGRVDEVLVVTGDMDALQLVESDGPVKVRVYVPGRGRKQAKVYKERDVEKRFGVEPEQVADYKGLCGDASDNIPGVKGVGPKKAVALLKQYKTVEGIYKHIDKVRDKFGERVARLLVGGHESALMSKRLATIVLDVPVELDLKKCRLHDYDKEKTLKLFKELEFRSLIKKLPNDDYEQMVQDALF